MNELLLEVLREQNDLLRTISDDLDEVLQTLRNMLAVSMNLEPFLPTPAEDDAIEGTS